MLVIVNPYATTVSDRLKNLVVYALRGRYEVRGGRHRGPRPRHRAVPRGGAGGLRRGGRLRRRRDRQRGRQRAGRVRHAAVLPARRPHQRLLPHARDPHRRRRRHRAPARHGPRLAAAPGRRRAGQRALLPVLGRGRSRRQRGRAGRRPSPAEGSLRRVVLRLDRRSGPSTATTCSTRRGCRPTSAPRRSTASPPSCRAPSPTPTSATGRSTWARAPSLDSGDLAGVVLRRANVLDIPSITWRALSKRAKLTRHRHVEPFGGLTEINVRSRRPAASAAGRRRLHRRGRARPAFAPARGHAGGGVTARRLAAAAVAGAAVVAVPGLARAGATAPPAPVVRRDWPDARFPGGQPVEPARRQAPGGQELGRADRRDRSRRSCASRFRHPSTTAPPTGSRSPSSAPSTRRVPVRFQYASESDAGRIRCRATWPSRAARRAPATAT